GESCPGLGFGGNGCEAFRWTAGGGMQGLGDLPGGAFKSRAFAVSADGSVIVGSGATSAGFEAFRWTAGEMVSIGDLPGGAVNSTATGISADGSAVAGWGTDAA